MSSHHPYAAGPAASPHCKTGAQVVVDALFAHGVDTVFGYIGAAIEQMLAEKKPCLVDFHVEAHENVWPMVPAGKGLHEMDGLRVLESAM